MRIKKIKLGVASALLSLSIVALGCIPRPASAYVLGPGGWNAEWQTYNMSDIQGANGFRNVNYSNLAVHEGRFVLANTTSQYPPAGSFTWAPLEQNNLPWNSQTKYLQVCIYSAVPLVQSQYTVNAYWNNTPLALASGTNVVTVNPNNHQITCHKFKYGGAGYYQFSIRVTSGYILFKSFTRTNIGV